MWPSSKHRATEFFLQYGLEMVRSAFDTHLLHSVVKHTSDEDHLPPCLKTRPVFWTDLGFGQQRHTGSRTTVAYCIVVVLRLLEHVSRRS